MSRFTETHFAHAFETATETWWGDWRCVCGHEGRIQNAADMPWPLKRLAIRRAHAAHVESMLVEAGVVAVEAVMDRTEYGVELVEYHDGSRGVTGPKPLHIAEMQVAHQLGRTWEDGTPVAPVLVSRRVIVTPWLPAAAVRPVTPEEPK